MHLRFLLPTVRQPRITLQRCLEYVGLGCFLAQFRLTTAPRNLKPGGWAEIHDIFPVVFSNDSTAGEDHPIHTLYRLIEGPFSELYRWNFGIASHVADVLRDVGFVNVTVRHNAIPIGRWHQDPRMKEMGVFAQSLISDWAVTMLTRHETLGLDSGEADHLGRCILDAFNNPQMHAQHDWIDVWAQKQPAPGNA